MTNNSKTLISQSHISRLVLLALGSLVSVGVTSCSRPEVVGKLSSPDGQQHYNCDKEQKDFGPIKCKTHWCWHFTQQDLEDLKKMNGVSWKPCFVRSGKTKRSASDASGGVSAGGVSWWWWNKGQVGDLVLKHFAVQDYRMVNGAPGTIYGDAVRQKDRKYCYDVKWSGKYWGTYCMVPMKEAASFLN
jgi:hypothetical protein